MGDFQQIRIKIAEKEYTLRIRQDEEAGLREAAKLLNERIKDLQKKSGVWDRQDLLAMIAFNAIVQEQKAVRSEKQGLEAVNELHNILQSHS